MVNIRRQILVARAGLRAALRSGCMERVRRWEDELAYLTWAFACEVA